MLTLGIETTCDETGIAVIRGTQEILSNQIASQADLHSKYGGVLPELASRKHVEVFLPLLKEAAEEAGVDLQEIDLIGVAYGPGLLGSLLVGVNGAKSLSLALNIPFLGINHLEAHLYASLMSTKEPLSFPALGVILSGGHTAILVIHDFTSFELVGQTQDDAVGEAFDKVAKMLGLPYPGGPQIEKLAHFGDPQRFSFKPPTLEKDPFGFSMSGVKTKVLYTLFGYDLKKKNEPIEETIKRDIAASFQKGVFDDIVKKVLGAARQFQCSSVLFGGGVTNSQTLRNSFNQSGSHLNLLWPDSPLSLDNGAMIGGLAAHLYALGKKGDPLSLTPQVRIPFKPFSH